VWVTSYRQPWLTRIDARTSRERVFHPHVANGILDVLHGSGALWIASRVDQAVLRVDARNGKVLSRIRTPLPPVAVAVSDTDLWVVGRAPAGEGQDRRLHYDPSGASLGSVAEPEGVGPIAFGAGWLWAASRTTSRLLRINPRTGEQLTWAGIGGRAFDLAYAGGKLWATVADADSVVRVDPHSGRTASSAIGHSPAELALADGRVFVACTGDHRVVVLNPDSLRRSGEPVPIGLNPYAMAAGAGHVWVTDIGANTVTRIDY
jgi:virginiamycin B lyase